MEKQQTQTDSEKTGERGEEQGTQIEEKEKKSNDEEVNETEE